MISEGTVYDQYFEWLYGRVASVRNKNPSRSRWNLLRKFYSTPFYSFVPNDENRILDGLDLRREWIDEKHIIDIDQDWLSLDCSVLEMLIALSRRLAFESRGSAVEWFWKLVDNLELYKYTDDIYEISIEEEVEEVLDNLVYRKYCKNGDGGLFPLNEAIRDQREVELWYQMSAYLLENDRVDVGPRA